jgi:hypothetical protein
MNIKITKKQISIILHILLIFLILGTTGYNYYKYNKIEEKTKSILKKNGIMKSSIQKLSKQMYKNINEDLKKEILKRHKKNYKRLKDLKILNSSFIEENKVPVIYVDKENNIQYFKVKIRFSTKSFKDLKKLLVIKYLDPKVDKIIEITNNSIILIHKEKIK